MDCSIYFNELQVLAEFEIKYIHAVDVVTKWLCSKTQSRRQTLFCKQYSVWVIIIVVGVFFPLASHYSFCKSYPTQSSDGQYHLFSCEQ